ncbi:hypothetical protein JOB18_031971, partial [Solea senegalensis]
VKTLSHNIPVRGLADLLPLMTLVISNTCGGSSSPAPDEQSGVFLSLCHPSHQRQIVVALPVVTSMASVVISETMTSRILTGVLLPQVGMSPASLRAVDSPQPILAVVTSPVSIHHRESVPFSIPLLTDSHSGLSPFPGTAASAVSPNPLPFSFPLHRQLYKFPQ